MDIRQTTTPEEAGATATEAHEQSIQEALVARGFNSYDADKDCGAIFQYGMTDIWVCTDNGVLDFTLNNNTGEWQSDLWIGKGGEDDKIVPNSTQIIAHWADDVDDIADKILLIALENKAITLSQDLLVKIRATDKKETR